jgi:hypothetical protein
MNNDESGKWAFTGGRVEQRLDRVLAAFVGNGFALGGERVGREEGDK